MAVFFIKRRSALIAEERVKSRAVVSECWRCGVFVDTPERDALELLNMRTRLAFCGLLFAAYALMSVGCTSAPRPETTVKHFLEAFNDKDLNVLLTCVDPKQERMFRASLRLIERLTGGRLPVEELLELVPGMYQMLQSQVSEDVNFRDVHVGRGRVRGEDAEVPVFLTVLARSRGLDNTQQQDLRFALHRYHEGWRIVGIKNK